MLEELLLEKLTAAGHQFGFVDYMIDYSDLDVKRMQALLDFFELYNEAR